MLKNRFVEGKRYLHTGLKLPKTVLKNAVSVFSNISNTYMYIQISIIIYHFAISVTFVKPFNFLMFIWRVILCVAVYVLSDHLAMTT